MGEENGSLQSLDWNFLHFGKFEMKLLVIILAFFHLATVIGHPVSKIL